MRLAEVVMKVLSVGRKGRRSSDRFGRQGRRWSPGLLALTGDHLVLLNRGEAGLGSHAGWLAGSEGERFVIFPRLELNTLVVGVTPATHWGPQSGPVP